ncbi:PAS domain S-box protein [bacterium]|nr:PAS domain S-box protein [bacterium]
MERKTTSGQLHAEMYRPMLEMFLADPQPKLLLDPDSGVIIETNTAASMFLERPPSRLRGKRLKNVVSLQEDNPLLDPGDLLDEMVTDQVYSIQLSPIVHRDLRVLHQRVNIADNYLLAMTLVDVTEQKQAERVRSQLADLSEAISRTSDLEELINLMRERLSSLFDTHNFFVALYDEPSGVYEFPYFKNEVEKRPDSGPLKNTLTDIVRRSGEPMLVGPDRYKELVRQKEVVRKGHPSEVWMAAPLVTPQGVIGVVGLQHYSDPNAYTYADLEVLEFVSAAVATTLERRRVVQALQSSEERFSTFIEKSVEGIWCIQLDSPLLTSLPVDEQVSMIAQTGRFIECNATFLQMYNLKNKQDLLGKTLLDIPARNISEKSNASLSRFISEGYRMTDGESWEELEGGNQRVYLNQLIGIIEDDRLVQIWGAQRDITVRRQVETDLSIQKAHLERFIENSPEGIVFVDSNDRIISVNREFSRMFGFTKEELIGEKNTLIVPERFLEESTSLVQAVEESESVALESVRRQKNGNEFEVSILGTPIRIDNHLAGSYWVYRDITQQTRSAKLQTALFHISEASSTSSDLNELLKIIHEEVSHLIDTTNFYVALYNSNRSLYQFAYFVDEQETLDQSLEVELPDSLTDYVRKNGPLLTGTEAELRELVKLKNIKVVGPLADSWLGVPLRTPEGTIGVVVVQSYNREFAYSDQDMDLLEFVSGHIATAIEHRRWQDAMTTSEERYRTLFRQSPLGILLFDRDFHVIDSNDRLMDMFQLKTAQLIGLNLRDLADRRFMRIAKRAIKGQTERIDGQFTSLDSSVSRWLTGSISPLYGSDQSILGGLVMIEDMTEKKETEQELELQRAYSHHLFQDAPEAILFVDPSLRILRVNDEFGRLFGYDVADLPGKKLSHINLLPKEGAESIDLKSRIKQADRVNLETIRQNKSGELIEVSILGGPVLMEKEPVAYFLIYRDISLRKRSERLQSVLYEIARAAATGIESTTLYGLVHQQLGRLIEVDNFSIALYNSELDAYAFPYHIDQYYDYDPEKYYPLKESLTDHVRSTGKSILIDRSDYHQLEEEGVIGTWKHLPKTWLGVPLRSGEKVFGVLSVVSYTNPHLLSDNDLELMEFISGQIAGMVESNRAEKELMVSEARYRALFEQAAVGVFLFDRDLKMINLNSKIGQMVGVPVEQLVGLNLLDLPDQCLTPMLKAAIEGKSEEYSGPYKTRTTRWELYVSARSSPLLDADGNVVGGICVALDVTEQKRSEQRAEINRIYLEQLFERSPEAIVLLDPRLRAIRVNREFTELFGFTSSDALSRSIGEWIIPKDENEDEGEHLHALKRIAKGELVRLDETRCVRKDGTFVETSLLGSPIVVDDKVIALYAIYRDITPQKRAVADLAEEKERLAVTLSSIGEGVITTDVSGQVVMMNQAAEEITGWSSNAASGEPFSTVFKTYDPDTGKELPDPVQRVIQRGSLEGWTRETLLQSRSGRDVILLGSAAPIHDVHGEVIGVVVVFRDVTDQRKLEEEMSKIERLESVGVLAGGIAHDFNNILAAVLGNISIARLIQDDVGLIHERLTEAENAAMRARDLTQQLLTFSRGGEPVRKSTNLEGLVRESAGFALRGSNVLSEFDIATDLWAADVDSGQVGRVFHNLVINADQAMPNGGKIEIRMRNHLVHEESTLPLNPGRYIYVTVKDEGVGIPADHLQKVFDPFFTTKQRGSGLGLATSFSIVQKHSGFMAVHSEVGKGTKFEIYLPAAETANHEPKVQPNALYHGEGRILVMDDEQSVQEVATVMLKELGFTVDVASDGSSAIEKYLQARMEEKPYVAVIMDLTIPGGMGGEETISHLRKLDPGVKAIVSSGYSNDPIMSNYLDFGFKGVVAKPYRLQDLGSVLAEVLE